MDIMEALRSPWPWYVAGPLIGLVVPLLLLIGNKSFGISSSLRHACAIVPSRVAFFRYDWRRVTTPSATDCVDRADATPRPLLGLIPYGLAGVAFGFVAMKSEIVSWYRIQEMFRFDAFHMYGVIGSAVLVAALSLVLLRRLGARSLDGEPIAMEPKARTWSRYALGGTAFGLGWGLVGACPGPIYALLGAGFPAFGVVLLGALLGTWLYGVTRARLPH